jgi:hypothetical protein
MTGSFAHLKRCLALVWVAWSVSACKMAPSTTPSLVVTPTPALSGSVTTPAPAPTATPEKPAAVATTIKAPPESVGKAVVADWEEMFRVTQSYEYVSANGRPDDKEWWIEQAKRFYIGRVRAEQLQQIEMMFKPDVPGSLGFIQDARYTVEVQNCSSATECVLQVRVQSGRYWAYDIHQKNWNAANPVEPAVWIVPMRYDSTTEHWKVN